MKLSGLLNRTARRNDAQAPSPGPAPARGPEATAGLDTADLDLERRWLQLALVDAEQFRFFFDRYHDHIFRYFAACVESEETAQDLTQETFLYALEHLGRFSWQGQPFGVWLFHIARRRVLTRHWRRPRVASEAEFARRRQSDAVTEDPGADLDRARLLDRLRRLVQELPPARRDAIVLHVQMEYSLEQAAAIMGISPLTVRSHVTRGQRQLAAAVHADPALSRDEKRSLGALAAEDMGLGPVPGRSARDGDGNGSRQERDDDDG